ncbi:DUF4747 family protein [Acinetobacter baumannii]
MVKKIVKGRGRARSVYYGGLNIVLNPHETAMVYVDLLYFIQNEIQVPITLKNNTSIYLYNLKEIHEGKPLDGLTGTLLKCTDIDIKEWFDLTEKTIVDEDSASKQVKIPPNYLANAKFFNFVFFPKKHLMVTEIKDSSGSVSISVFKNYFEAIFSKESFQKKFTSGHVTAITDDKKVEGILGSKKLLKLNITLNKPNPDDLSSLKGRIMGHLAEIKAKRLQVIATAEESEYLEPDQQLEDLSRVAADNGEVEAVLIIDGERQTVSTTAYPKILKDAYYPKEISQEEFLLIMAKKYFDDI